MDASIATDPQFAQFVTWGFYTAVTMLLYSGVRSIAKLNENVAVIIARVDTHEKRLDRHDELLDDVKQNH